jgi:hypothetical protein
VEGPAGPAGAHAADDDVLAFVDLQRVTLAVLQGEAFDGEITGVHQHALGAVHQTGEVQDRRVLAGAAHGDAVHVQAEAGVEMVGAGGDGDDVAGFGIDQLGEQGGLLVAVDGGGLAVLLATGRRQRGCQNQGGAQKRSP